MMNDDPTNSATRATDFKTQIQDKIDKKTKPIGSLGRIEELAAQIAQLQNSAHPSMNSCELIIFAADHGMANAGVSAYPQAVTRQMVLNFLSGGAASNVFCDTLGIAFNVVDAGIAGDPIEHPNLISKPVNPGTANAIEGPAMSATHCKLALDTGYEIGSQVESDAVCFGEMGIGNTSSASLLFHKILGISLEDITGAGTGLDREGIRNKYNLLNTASNRTASSLSAGAALQEYGGFEIAMMAGAMQSAAKNNKLIIVDGFIATAAAIVAQRLDETVQQNLVYSHMSNEQGHQRVLEVLNIQPLLQLGLRLGEGTGALLAWPLIKSSAAMLNNMASFESANVSGPA